MSDQVPTPSSIIHPTMISATPSLLLARAEYNPHSTRHSAIPAHLLPNHGHHKSHRFLPSHHQCAKIPTSGSGHFHHYPETESSSTIGADSTAIALVPSYHSTSSLHSPNRGTASALRRSDNQVKDSVHPASEKRFSPRDNVKSQGNQPKRPQGMGPRPTSLNDFKQFHDLKVDIPDSTPASTPPSTPRNGPLPSSQSSRPLRKPNLHGGLPTSSTLSSSCSPVSAPSPLPMSGLDGVGKGVVLGIAATDDGKAGPTRLTVQNFLAKNDVEGLKQERDDVRAWKKWIFAVVVLYFFVTPLLPIFDTFGSRAWLLPILWSPVTLIVLGYFEGYARAELWHILICKGLILDFDKTPFYRKLLFYVNILLILLVCALVWVMDENSDNKTRAIRACMYLFAMSFTFEVVKGVVDVEGSNRIHTLNRFLWHARNPRLLEPAGYKVIHFTQLAVFTTRRRKISDPPAFSWNDLFVLPHERSTDFHAEVSRWQCWAWGSVTWWWIRRFANSEE